jgi:hypothetical protein
MSKRVEINEPEPTPASLCLAGIAAAAGDDAGEWAAAFVRAARTRLDNGDDAREVLLDAGWMIGWFANAIEQSAVVRAGPEPAVDLAQENFALAADQCHHGYSDEHGHHRCLYQDKIEALEAEIARLRTGGIVEAITCAIHCDDLIEDSETPEPLRQFLAFHRQPAAGKRGDGPVLFATMKVTDENSFAAGTRVRVVMASRFGDVGITTNLDAVRGYMARVPVGYLEDFSREAK